MTYSDKLDGWVQTGLLNGMAYMLVMQDLEDKEYYPVYFGFYSDCQRYQNNIISESKLRVVEFVKLIRYKDSNERPA